jgi:hypothetical protein
MLQDTDFFTQLERWSTLGDVLPSVHWVESVSPDERYEIAIEWKFRSKTVGTAYFIIEPIIEDPGHFRLYWVSLQFTEDWQAKGLYTTIVNSFSPNMLRYGVIECVATPTDKIAEARLAAGGFEWRGQSFVLDFQKVTDRLSHLRPS